MPTTRSAKPAILAQHGITITSNDGEYRVAFAGKERRSLGLLHARWGRCDRNRHRDAQTRRHVRSQPKPLTPLIVFAERSTSTPTKETANERRPDRASR